MNEFSQKHIQCSSCPTKGLNNSILYDAPRFSIFTLRTNDTRCVNLIDEVDLLSIHPTLTSCPFEYSIQTAMIVLEDDEIFYLRKTTAGFSYFNRENRQFELLNDFVAAQTSLAAKWIIFIFETGTTVFTLKDLKKTVVDQNGLKLATEPEVWSINIVQTLLPTFTRSFDVGPVLLQPSDIDRLLAHDVDVNDLIINSYLFVSSTTVATRGTALAISSYFVSNIIENRLRRFEKSWLDYEMILCPIHQDHHWYIVILDLKQKVVVELDSLVSHNLNRDLNRERLLHVLDTQYYLKNNQHLDIQTEWQVATPLADPPFQQDDAHSCGVHLLVQAHAYITEKKFSHISNGNVKLHRYRIAYTILRHADPTPSDSEDSVSCFFLS